MGVEIPANSLAAVDARWSCPHVNNGGSFSSPTDRLIRLIMSFGIALLTGGYMLTHPQLVAARPVIAVALVCILAWLFVYFRIIMSAAWRQTTLAAVAPYVTIGIVALMNWQYGAQVSGLKLLFPAVGLLPAYGRSRRQGWGLTVATAVAALVTPWLAGQLRSGPAWHEASYMAGATLLAVGCFTELHYHHNAHYAQQAQRLQRAETMATVGLMATAAAHEIRNPLTTIKGFIQYMRHHRLVDARANEYLALLEDDAERIARTVDRFVRLGRPLSPAPKTVDAADVVCELAAELSAPALLVGIEIDVQTQPVLPVWADVSLLQKAVRHTLQNALEAMAGRSGRLTVRVGPGPPGYVEIRVHDTGPGMDRQQMARAFDAFYTTKSGAGLGLPLVRRILDAHGGDVRLRSSRRHGTTVSMIWPTETTYTPAVAAGGES